MTHTDVQHHSAPKHLTPEQETDKSAESLAHKLNHELTNHTSSAKLVEEAYSQASQSYGHFSQHTKAGQNWQNDREFTNKLMSDLSGRAKLDLETGFVHHELSSGQSSITQSALSSMGTNFDGNPLHQLDGSLAGALAKDNTTFGKYASAGVDATGNAITDASYQSGLTGLENYQQNKVYAAKLLSGNPPAIQAFDAAHSINPNETDGTVGTADLKAYVSRYQGGERQPGYNEANYQLAQDILNGKVPGLKGKDSWTAGDVANMAGIKPTDNGSSGWTGTDGKYAKLASEFNQGDNKQMFAAAGRAQQFSFEARGDNPTAANPDVSHLPNLAISDYGDGVERKVHYGSNGQIDKIVAANGSVWTKQGDTWEAKTASGKTIKDAGKHLFFNVDSSGNPVTNTDGSVQFKWAPYSTDQQAL